MIAEVLPLPKKLATPLLIETWIIGLAATLDCLSTIYLLHSGKAIEANPLLAATASWSLFAFFVLKMSFVVGPLYGLERIRRTPGRERFVQLLMRCGIFVYAFIYFGGLLLQFKFPDLARSLHLIRS